eukprot:TCONS_00000377-protein
MSTLSPPQRSGRVYAAHTILHNFNKATDKFVSIIKRLIFKDDDFCKDIEKFKENPSSNGITLAIQNFFQKEGVFQEVTRSLQNTPEYISLDYSPHDLDELLSSGYLQLNLAKQLEGLHHISPTRTVSEVSVDLGQTSNYPYHLSERQNAIFYNTLRSFSSPNENQDHKDWWSRKSCCCSVSRFEVAANVCFFFIFILFVAS